MKDPHKLDPRAMERSSGGSNLYHGTIMKDPHKPRVLASFRGLKSLSRDNYEGSTQGGSNPYHGTIMKDPHKLDPRAMERSKVVSWLHLKEAHILITGQL